MTPVTNCRGPFDTPRVTQDDDPGAATAMYLRSLAGVFAVIGLTDVLLAVFAMELWPVAMAIATGMSAWALWRRAGTSPATTGLRRPGPSRPDTEQAFVTERAAAGRSPLQHDRAGGDRRQRPA